MTSHVGALDALGLRLAADHRADCNADEPVSGRGCDLAAGHPGGHLAGTTQWSTRGQELDAIVRDLDTSTNAWVAAGYPFEGPEARAREDVFARLHGWNEAVALDGRAVAAPVR